VFIIAIILIKIVADSELYRLQQEADDLLESIDHKYEELIEKEKDIEERLENIKNKSKE
jgi:cell division septum initiation protein DivIVA